MKKLTNVILSCIVLMSGILILSSFDNAAKSQPLKVAMVNFKKCVELSKLGKQEQANFESLKKQMETVLGEKEKTLNEMAAKFNDPDYLDSLSPEAETDLKRKFRSQNQELAQLQSQYMQTLQQTNFKVIQKLNEMVTKAANAIAKEDKYDIILNEESSFFYGPHLDISTRVIAWLDDESEKMPKESKEENKSPAILDQLR